MNLPTDKVSILGRLKKC